MADTSNRFYKFGKNQDKSHFLANFPVPTTMGLGTLTAMKYNKFVQIPIQKSQRNLNPYAKILQSSKQVSGGGGEIV
jgi:hypothetical protein